MHPDEKIIIEMEFAEERHKKRLIDDDKNKELVSHVGNALTVIEGNIKKNILRLETETIEQIYPQLKTDNT